MWCVKCCRSWLLLSLALQCQANSKDLMVAAMSLKEGVLQSHICPLLSRHVEAWDERADGSGFKSRFHSKELSELPAGCSLLQSSEETQGVREASSFLQIGASIQRKMQSNTAVGTEYRPALVPYPKSVTLLDAKGSFVISKATTIRLDRSVSEDLPYVKAALTSLRTRLAEATNHLPEAAADQDASVITLGLSSQDGANPEGYRLTAEAGSMLLEAYGKEGFTYGVTTMKQLIPLPAEPQAPASLTEVAGNTATDAGVIPAMVIEDAPEFKWRGLHLDVSRHFFPADEVMKLLDTMAAYKLNRFHWHLTDDQGWRLPVRGYPKLTEKGAGPRYKGDLVKSSGTGIEGSYTEQDIQNVLLFAKARHIQVIPEVDVPGHAAAAIAAYPELGNPDFDPPVGPQHEYGVHQWTLAPTKTSADFLATVFSEVARQFPDSEYIHFGGDEAPQDQWRKSSAKAKRAWESFEGDNAQSYFNQKVSALISGHGKKVAGWDEVQSMEGLPKDAAIFAWRGENELRKALDAGRPAINAENGHLYLDHYQGPEGSEPHAIGGPLLTTKGVYEYQVMPSWVKEEDKHLMLGAQGQLWSEYFPDMHHVEYMAWPRSIALAERLWSPQQQLSYPDFSNRLNSRLGDLKHWGVNYHALEA